MLHLKSADLKKQKMEALVIPVCEDKEIHENPEIKAVIEASEAWGTYVTAHIYLPDHAQRAINLGLKEILHIPYLDRETAELMVKKGIFYNPQLSQSTPDSSTRHFETMTTWKHLA